MKTRKIIAIAAISVVAVFFLAGCDQILENLFPNDTGHGTTAGTNTLTVSAFMWTDPVYVTSGYVGKIHIDLVDSSGTVVQTYSTWANGYDQYTYDYWWGTGDYYYRYPVSTTFYYVNDGTYKVNVYCDLNGNNQYDVSSEYFASNNYSYYTGDSIWQNHTGYSTVSLSNGSSSSVTAYIDYYDWEFYGAFGY